MSRYRLTRLLAPMAVAFAFTVAVPAPAPAQPKIENLADLVDSLLPSVVNINMYDLRKPPADAPAGTLPSVHRKFGSGFIVHESGIVVTNRHVARDGIFYVIRMANGEAFRAELIAEAEGIDLAVMKIVSDRKFPALKIGDSSKLRRGDAVIAIGNPLGWSSSVSTGIISALDRSIGSGTTDNFIQTDAAINQGNSGGPLFNEKGEVVGINAAILTTSNDGGNVGIGFAIPVNDAKFVVMQLLKYGEIRPGWLGIDGQNVDAEMAITLGMKGVPHGVIVSSVAAGSPGASGGVRVGDVVTAFNGATVTNIRELRRATAEAEAGTKIKMSLMRDGKAQEVMLTSAPFPNQAALQGRTGKTIGTAELPGNLGLTLSEMTDALRTQFKIAPGVKGLVATDVAVNSQAYNQGIRTGDVIELVQGDAVVVPVDLRSRVDAFRTAGHDLIRFLVTGPDGTRWVTVMIATKI